MENDAYSQLKKWFDDTRYEPLETMAGFFDKRVENYEEHMSQWSQHYKWMAKLLPDNTKCLLDIGCGTGLELDCIFERFSDLQVTGVDISKQMLDRLRCKHSGKELSLICMDYFNYDMGEKRFDAVISFETLHHFEYGKKQMLFKKIHRCLKPGGIYLECDYIALTQQIEELAFAECQRRRKRDGIPDDVFVHFDTPLTLEHEIQAVKSAGFSEVTLVGFLEHDDHTPIIRAIK